VILGRLTQTRIRISRLAAIELTSAFEVKVRTKVIVRQDGDELLRQFRDEAVGKCYCPIFNSRRSTGEENTMLVVGTPKSSNFSTTWPSSLTLAATTFMMNASPPAT
jgi:hypothetical protein